MHDRQSAIQPLMQILFLTSRLPFPPDRGDKLRTFQFLRLFARDHEVTLLSFIENEKERQLAKKLADYCKNIHLLPLPAWKSGKNVIANFWQALPLQTLYYQSWQMQEVVENLLSTSSFDVAYLHLFRMAQYLENHAEIYRILDLTDLVSYEIRNSIPYQSTIWQLIYRFELPRIVQYEKRITTLFDEVWFISQRDRALLLEDRQQINSQVVPHGTSEIFTSVKQDLTGPLKILFVGNLEVWHNVDAVTYMAEQIMPLLLQAAPGLEFQIIGAGDKRKVLALDTLPGVCVVGYVSDLKTVFRQNAIAVAPLRFSAGVQNKVIESMSAGLPVVTTSNVNAGLDALPERDLLVADNAQDFAYQVLRLVRDGIFRQRLGEAGRAFVKAHFSTQKASDRLLTIRSQLKV
jgi:sugar transferase (PEP-CTERM/EpsH1 system associated)